MELKDRVVEHIPRLQRYARALVRGSVHAADDLVQDCLVRALSRIHQWRSDTDLRAWLFTIMHNVYVNHVRRTVNGPQFQELAEEDPPDSTPAGVESATTLRELQRALDTLSPDQREIVLLVGVEGLRYQEVASILGLPEGTVMSRLSRARQHLRKALSHDQSPLLRRVK